MKRHVITAIVAVAVVAGTQAQANAHGGGGGGFGFGFGFGIGLSFSGSTWSCAPSCQPSCGPTCCGMPAGGYPGSQMSVGAADGHAAAPGYYGGHGYAAPQTAVAWQAPAYNPYFAYNYPVYGYGYHQPVANVAPWGGALANAR